MFKEIKRGFFFGIGFTIPLVFVSCAVIYYSFYAVSSFTEEIYDETLSGFTGDESFVDNVTLSKVSETQQGVQLLIAGQFTNNHEESLNSLEIEAELFDDNGNFVYECSKSFYDEIPSGATENYLIKCGCSQNGIPEYSTVKVRVVKASVY